MFYSCKSEIISIRSTWTFTLLKNFLFQTSIKSIKIESVFIKVLIGAERSRVHDIALKFTINFISLFWFFFLKLRLTKLQSKFYLSSLN